MNAELLDEADFCRALAQSDALGTGRIPSGTVVTALSIPALADHLLRPATG